MSLKLQYKKLFHSIQILLNEIDPEHLSPGREEGAPVSEYEMEATDITRFLLNNFQAVQNNPNTIKEEIDKIWKDYFGKSCNKSNKLTESIMCLLKGN